jgi:hypothetical protein
MVVMLNASFTEEKSPRNGLSFCMLVSSIVIEITILLIDQVLAHLARHPVVLYVFQYSVALVTIQFAEPVLKLQLLVIVAGSCTFTPPCVFMV